MTYNTTGTTDFNLPFSEIAEEAFERCGMEMRTGYDLRTARRSLNLLMLDWANRGINMWTIEQGSITLVAGTGTYDLPLDTVDLIEHQIRTGTDTNQTDISISRISVSTFATIPNKNATGRPIQIWIQRRTGATGPTSVTVPPRITVWPLPDNNQTYTLIYYRLRRMQDAGNGNNGEDIPFRLLPALVSGLAYMLAFKVAPDRIQMLKEVYDNDWQNAADEDREKAPMRLVPRMSIMR
jgi:hypothetical protein